MGTSANDVSVVLLGHSGTDHGHHCRCTSTRDGQDLLRVFAMEATTQEATVTGMSATSRIGDPEGR
jgi:hypothetical protein